MAGNIYPIFSAQGIIQGGSNGSGKSANTAINGTGVHETIFSADETNGGRLERIRFRALGTNVATVARVWVWDNYNMVLSAVAFTAMTQAGQVVTGTTASAHGLSVGQTFTVAGVTPSGYNGTYIVATVPSATTLTFRLNVSPGTVTVQGNFVTVNFDLYDEITLPATTLSQVAALANQEIFCGLVLPPGYRITLTYGTATAAGYAVAAIGGKF